MHRKALGRGLDALIPTRPGADVLDGPTAQAPSGGEGVREVAISDIGPNPFQPRQHFDDEALRELAASIKSAGVLQPLLLRKHDDGYQLVAGERRLRAASFAGLSTVPAIVKEIGDREMLEYALIENIQREELNPIEEAKAYQALIERTGLKHEEVSERVGKQRVTVTNALRLLGLPPEVQDMIARGTLTAGHGRAIMGIESKGDQLASARYVSAKGFSVRRTEAYVRRKLRLKSTRPAAAHRPGLNEWEVKLQQQFSTHVAIRPGRKGGRVEFEYYGQEDLERLLQAWGVL